MPQAKRILITTRSTLLAAAAMALCIPAAHAWDYTAPAPTPTPSATITNSPMGGAGGLGGQGGTGGAGGNAHAAASARGGNAHASGGNASVAVTIDPATTATPASGAADPSTTGRRSAGDPADPSGARHGGTGHGGGHGGGGNTTINENTAPQITLPSIGGGGSDCPVVGFGVGGSGLGGGGGFGPSWISSRCDHRKYAELIAELQGKAAALAYLCRVEGDTCAAPVATSATVPISTAPAAPAPDCAAINLAQTGHGKMSPSELAAYRECRA